MDRYIGLDAHSSSCTVAVIGPTGRRLQSQVLETNARALISFLKTIPKQRHLCLEEGTHANWLHEVLAPHVEEIAVVPGIGKRRASRNDQRDAFTLAEDLRIGAIQTRVYKGLGEFGLLRELSRAYTMLVNDSVRVQNRIKSLYRSRGIPTGSPGVYLTATRQEWLRKLPTKVRPVAGLLYQELDCVRDLQKRAAKKMLAEAQKHRIARLLRSCPGMGVIRVAQMLSIVVTPYRFSSKRAFWAYAGLAIVTRSSSDWIRAADGSWVKLPVHQTRGLNRNGNRTLKQIFKGASTTVIRDARREDPLYRHYQQLLGEGTRPNLAKLTIARQIASIVLSMWRSEEVYNPAKLKKAT
jgi:transposase